jgi:hypothetical protein
MLTVVTIISYDNTLLKHFVNYYHSLGVESFIIAIDERTPTIWSSTQEIAATIPVQIKLVPASERQRLTGLEKNNKEEIREKYLSRDDWFIPADLDEFIQFPASIPQLINEMVKEGATFINGAFSDRLSSTGVLTQTEESPSIWEQYPLEAEVSAKLVRCWCTKVTLARGDCILTSGHHNVIAPCKPLVARKCTIHHFKWRHGLKEALERRIVTYKAQKIANYSESEHIISYLKKNERIAPEEFNPKKGWNPSIGVTKRNSVIYTAISNGYDILKDPTIPIDSTINCVAFTDAKLSSMVWDTEPLHNEYIDSCRNAKIHKILPHRFFPNAEYSLWIDGSVILKPDFDLNKLIDKYLVAHDLAVFKHHSRKGVYAEAEACIRLRKDHAEVIKAQMRRYEYESYPRRQGLASCTIILRRHSESVRQFNEVWWEEIKNHSKRDQLSFNYVAWKLGVKYRQIDGSIKKNSFFSVIPHLQR